MPSSSSSSSKPAKRPSVGRQKIEIKRVEQSSKRHVTFSKRKLGLFRKAAELSLLCDSEIAVVVFSQKGKVYSSGHPEPDSVIRRYLAGSSSNLPPLRDREIESAKSSLRQEYEESKKELEEEKKRLDAISEIRGSGRGHGFWWNNTIADMDLENVEQFKVCTEQLRQNLVAAAEKKRVIKSPPPPPMMTAMEFPYVPMLNGDLLENLETDQAWDYSWNGSTSGSSFLIPDSLGHY